MTINDFGSYSKKNLEFLDTIDFSNYLHYEDVGIIMNKIEDDFHMSHKELPDFLGSYVFNFLSDEDVANYLSRRYDLVMQEECRYLVY